MRLVVFKAFVVGALVFGQAASSPHKTDLLAIDREEFALGRKFMRGVATKQLVRAGQPTVCRFLGNMDGCLEVCAACQCRD